MDHINQFVKNNTGITWSHFVLPWVHKTEYISSSEGTDLSTGWICLSFCSFQATRLIKLNNFSKFPSLPLGHTGPRTSNNTQNNVKLYSLLMKCFPVTFPFQFFESFQYGAGTKSLVTYFD